MVKPILYSFRRCPYAIRARLGLAHCVIDCEVREVELRNKPESMLEVSPKGTVPVLCLDDGRIIDESLEIMMWAVAQTLVDDSLNIEELKHPLLVENDGTFKERLDRYKYFDRHPEHPQQYYWSNITPFLEKLEQALVSGKADVKGFFLVTPQASLLDWAIFPFVRQCYFVDPKRFETLGLSRLNRWLRGQLSSELFIKLMRKRPFWYSQGDSSYSLLEAL